MASKNTMVESAMIIQQLNRASRDFHIVGMSPMVMNPLSEKAKRDLLFPPRKKNTVERETTLKHDPIREFRSSVHRMRDTSGPTLLATPSTAWKSALRSAALDIKGAKKAQVGRLSYIEGEMVPVWGVPLVYMAGVRNSDMNRTPDIRTRAILPRWAAIVRVAWVTPNLTMGAILNLLHNAGITQGIGDGRPEKGAMSFGQFRVCEDEHDSEFQEIVAAGGRAAQQSALETPVAYDDTTSDLLHWFAEELGRRQLEIATATPKKSRAKKDAAAVDALLETL